MRAIVVRGSLLALAVCSTATERPASACGGCFIRAGTENSVVTDHRMAFSVSPQQTVLWDQIKYSGNPKAFSWVLPVRSGAILELSHDEWFAALDGLTAPVITGPVRNCSNSAAGGGGCGGVSKVSGFASASAAGAGGSGVEVISQSVVGPYDTVTVRSTDPHALETWLDVNGYAIPDSFRPTIAAYVGEGFDFIALRLQPGEGVQSMQPVRVVTQGADAALPLRMVAAGVGAQVGITLFVISEGRYEAQAPFFNAVVDDSQLVWRHKDSRSNFQELSQQLMQSNAGRTWLTEFAGLTSLQTSQLCRNAACGGNVTGGGGTVTYYGGQTLADVYLAQCRGKPGLQCPRASSFEAGDDASGDSSGDAACNPDPCADFDDLDVALVGLHPVDTWVTRMRADLLSSALVEGDLHIQASQPQTPVSNRHATDVFDDPTYSPCGTQGGCSASPAEASPFETWLAVGALGFVGVALVRRRRRFIPLTGPASRL
jgi:MYXO-CTERM domain-containing protein